MVEMEKEMKFGTKEKSNFCITCTVYVAPLVYAVYDVKTKR